MITSDAETGSWETITKYIPFRKRTKGSSTDPRTMWGLSVRSQLWSQTEHFRQVRFRACLKNHSRHLYAPLCVIFAPYSVDVAHYASFIWHKSPTNCDAHLTESSFQTRSSVPTHLHFAKWLAWISIFCIVVGQRCRRTASLRRLADWKFILRHLAESKCVSTLEASRSMDSSVEKNVKKNCKTEQSVLL